MDFNDIKSRLIRTLNSLNGRYDGNIEKNINTFFSKEGNFVSQTTTFGNKNEEELNYNIISILQILATFKDHLKKCLKKNNYGEQLIEGEINDSLHLQVLMDLVNQEKHGYPLTKTTRSKKDPIITNPLQWLGLSPEPGSDAMLFAIENNGNTITHGQSSIFINAEIRDSAGNFLFSLDELVNTCYIKWLTIANTYNCCDVSIDEFKSRIVSSPATLIQNLSVIFEERPQVCKIEVNGNVRCTEIFYEFVDNQYLMIDNTVPVPMRMLYGSENRSNEEMGREYDELLRNFMSDIVIKKIDEFKKSDGFQLGTHSLESQGDLILERGIMKVKAEMSNEPFKIVEKITMQTKFKIKVYI